MVKNPPANVGHARDTVLIPGSGRFPGGRNGNPLQSSCLGNPTDRGAWQVQFMGSQRHNLVTKQQQNTKSCCSHLNKGLELQREGILAGNNNVIDDEASELDLGRWAGF